MPHSNIFLDTLIIPSVRGEGRGGQAEEGLRRTSWGDACHVVFWMMDFVQAGRLPKGLWRCKKQKVV